MQANTETIILTVEGYHLDTPNLIETVNVSLGSWSGIEDYVDNDIFFYTEGDPVSVGSILSDDFVVTAIDIDENLSIDLDGGLSAINE